MVNALKENSKAFLKEYKENFKLIQKDLKVIYNGIVLLNKICNNKIINYIEFIYNDKYSIANIKNNNMLCRINLTNLKPTNSSPNNLFYINYMLNEEEKNNKYLM